MATGVAGAMVAGMAVAGGAAVSADTGTPSNLLAVLTLAPKRDNLDLVSAPDAATPFDTAPQADGTPPDAPPTDGSAP